MRFPQHLRRGATKMMLWMRAAMFAKNDDLCAKLLSYRHNGFVRVSGSRTYRVPFEQTRLMAEAIT